MSRFVLGAFVVAALVASSGCRNPLLEPADMLANVTVGPEYLKYVDRDPTLTDDDKRYRQDNVNEFRRLIKEVRDARF